MSGNAVAYVRMSAEHQRYSMSNQLVAIQAFCDARGWELSRIYSDVGKSGLRIENRPGLLSLISDAEAGRLGARTLVAYDLSRFGRFQNIDESAYHEQVLKRAGVSIVYCAEPFEYEAPSTAAIFKAVKRAMAAEYSRELSRRVGEGMRARAMAKDWCSSKPGYGFRRVLVGPDGDTRPCPKGRVALAGYRPRLVVGPIEEQRAIRRIFELYVLQEKSCKTIASMMEAEGWPRPAGRGWHRDLIRYILACEKYAGACVYGRTRVVLRRLAPAPTPDEWIRHEGHYPQIVGRELFARAQARRRLRAKWFDHAEIIEGLRALHRREGVVTQRLIDEDPRLPSAWVVGARFGAIGKACAAAGLPELTAVETRVLAYRLGKIGPRR